MSGIALSSAVNAGPRVDISSGGGAQDVGAGAAFARVALESDGDIVSEVTSGASDVGDWIVPKAAAPGAYEVMAHQDSGDALDGSSDALDTWLPLTSSRDWSVTQVGSGAKLAQLTISIRLGSTVLSSGVFTLDAQAL